MVLMIGPKKMGMLMHKIAVRMYMLVNQIRSQEKIVIVQNLSRTFIRSNPMIFAHYYGSVAYFLNDIQIMSSCDYDLALPFPDLARVL
jgi:hypothetical protein